VLIDAHHHLWEYNHRDYVWMSGEMTLLRRNFLVPELEAVIRDAGVDGTVVVQARQSTQETEWLLGLAERNPFILGVVGWVPLCTPEVARELDRFALRPQLKAVRHVLHDEPDDLYMLRDDFNRGVAMLKDHHLAYDILIFERHLSQTIEFVDRHPRQVFVLDHMAKPRIKEGAVSPWKEKLRELARRQNVYCKISGMSTEADWKNWNADQLKPYFDVVISAFGAHRLMFGSDWPVLTLAGDYNRWVNTFRSFIAELSPDEQERICSRTSKIVYRL
jgi:L-fuconolactonase